YLKSYTTKGTSTRANMRVGIVLLVNLFGRRSSWWTANVLIVIEKLNWLRKKATFLRCLNIRIGLSNILKNMTSLFSPILERRRCSITSCVPALRIYVYPELLLNGGYPLLLMKSMLYTYGLMPCPII